MLELVITIGIFALISVFFLTFQSDVFSLNSLVTNTFSSQQESQQLLVAFINEVRPASNSGTGAYPIAEATSNAFTFYTDIQNVGVKQRIRYFLENGAIKKSTLIPTGSPPTYNEENENTTTVMYGIQNGSNPLFKYYDNTYNGSSPPLEEPVNIPDIRFVKITAIRPLESSKSTTPRTYTTQVMLRNLKDNF